MRQNPQKCVNKNGMIRINFRYHEFQMANLLIWYRLHFIPIIENDSYQRFIRKRDELGEL